MRHRTGRMLVGAVAVGALLVGCTGHGDPDPRPSGKGPTGAATSSSAAEGMTRQQLQDAVFQGDVGSSTVLGSAVGKVPDRVNDLPARIDVTEVTAGPTSTLVRFTLVSTGTGKSNIGLGAFNAARPVTAAIRDVAIVDAAAKQRYLPYIGASVQDAQKTLCACSTAPVTMSSVGQLMSATYPALDPSATSITLSVPGFPDIVNLPVTRP